MHVKIIHFISLIFYKDAYLFMCFYRYSDRYKKVFPLLYTSGKPSC